MKRHIPNSLTLLNLLSGCLGIYFVFQDNLAWASMAIWIAAIFDFFDGFAARQLKVVSAIGKELDSLADMVSFGVLPAFIMMSLVNNEPYSFIRFVPIIIALFAALRLAKFNTDNSQSNSFLGMPTPSIAFFISGLPYWNESHSELFSWSIVIGTSVVLAALMVVPVRMIALKFNNFTVRDNWHRYGLILIGLLLLLVQGPKSFTLTISLYLLLSLIAKENKAIN